jgi:mannose-1-phosphate guanylyltransferase
MNRATLLADPLLNLLGWLAIKWWKFCWNHGLITFTLQNYRETMRSANGRVADCCEKATSRLH